MSDVTPRPGTGGGTKPIVNAETNEIIMKGDTDIDLVGSGVYYDEILDKYVFPKSIQTPSGSVELGTGVSIGEIGSEAIYESFSTDNVYTGALYPVTQNVDISNTGNPFYTKLGEVQIDYEIQPIDTIDTTVTTFQYAPPFSFQDNSFKLNAVNQLTNFRIKLTSNNTGNAIRYFPSEQEWDNNTGITVPIGVSEVFRENTVINGVKQNAFRFFDLLTFTTEYKADQDVILKGDGTSPWIIGDIRDMTVTDIIDENAYPIESISTSLIKGGRVTENTSTTIDIVEGNGRIITFDVNGLPVTTLVSWEDITNLAITNIITTVGTRIAIDINGDVAQLPPELTPQISRSYINLAVVGHATGIIGTIINELLNTKELYSQFIDNLGVLGVTRKTGLSLDPNANLTINKTAGEIETPGGGNESGNIAPNIVLIAAQSPASFARLLGITDTIETLDTTFIDPLNYDDGTINKAPIGVPTSKATIQYVFQSTGQPGGLFIMYGQTVYSTLSEALVNASLDVFSVPDIISNNTNLIARIALRSDALDLSDTLQAVILGGVKFGTGLF